MISRSTGIIIALCISLALNVPANAQDHPFKLYPHLYDTMPAIESPGIFQDTIEVLLVKTNDDRFGIVPVTMENGKPLVYSYKVGTMMGKDQQLGVDAGDFPQLAKTGLHSEAELDKKKMITGIPVEVINCTAKPDAYSYSGFLAEDEDIISVLRGDNRLVKSMDLTHPDLARPLFHIWNLILQEIELGFWPGRYYDHIKHFYYNDNILRFTVSGSKGWQLSIFFDEIHGRHDIHVERTLSTHEKEYLEEKYAHLNDEEMGLLIHKLTYLHMSEMLPFYIMRYGFYEGHTEDYRCDPITIAFLFGLKSIEEIDKAFEGDLLNTFQKHYNSK